MSGQLSDPDLVARFLDLWHAGLSTRAIGRQLGVSYQSVIRKAHRLGLGRPSPIHAPRVDVAVLRELKAQGLRVGKIGERVGMSRTGVQSALRRAGVGPARPGGGDALPASFGTLPPLPSGWVAEARNGD